MITHVLDVEKKIMKSLSAFLLLFFVDKKIAFKRYLDLYFHCFIIEFRMKGKIYTKSVVDVSRDAGEFFCFSARDWEGVSRNLLSLVELYQRI